MKNLPKALPVLLVLFILSDCSQRSSEELTKRILPKVIPTAEQTKIDGLQDLLTRLLAGQTEFDFMGITSNGVDCIYFMRRADGHFDIDFEAISEDQLPYLDILRKFGDANGFKSTFTTYGNRPNFKSDEPAKVVHIDTDTALEETARVGERIEREIFKNNSETVYDVVP